MCALRHEPLLDAAHILPDRDERGNPVVANELSLCRIHHGAYDIGIVGVDRTARGEDLHALAGQAVEQHRQPVLAARAPRPATCGTRARGGSPRPTCDGAARTSIARSSADSQLLVTTQS